MATATPAHYQVGMTLDDVLKDPAHASLVARPEIQKLIAMFRAYPSDVTAKALSNVLGLGNGPNADRHLTKEGRIASNLTNTQRGILGGAMVGGLVAVPALLGGGAAAAGAGGGSGAAGGSTAAGVGSTVGKIVSGLQAGGKIAGSFADAMSANREYDDFYNENYDERERRRGEFELEKAGLDLTRRQFANDSYDRDFRNAIRGGFLSGVQDVDIQAPDGIPMGSVSGGLRPSAILDKEKIGNRVRQDALRGLLNPLSADDVPDAPLPNITAGMTKQQVQDEWDRYVASRGKQSLPTSREQWGTYWDEWGHKDPEYLARRMRDADEFTGGPRKLPPLPTLGPLSTPRSRGKAEKLLGGINLLGQTVPLLRDLFGGPKPLPPTIRSSGRPVALPGRTNLGVPPMSPGVDPSWLTGGVSFY